MKQACQGPDQKGLGKVGEGWDWQHENGDRSGKWEQGHAQQLSWKAYQYNPLLCNSDLSPKTQVPILERKADHWK